MSKKNTTLAEIELFTTSAKVNIEARHDCLRKSAVILHKIKEVQEEINNALTSEATMTGHQWEQETELMKRYKLLQFEAEELLGEAEQDIRRAKALRKTLES